MTYNPNIPQDIDVISKSQGDLLANFQQLDSIFDKDHYKYSFSTEPAPYDLATSANRGQHKQVTLLNLSADVAAAATTGLIYTKTANTRTDLYYRYDSGGSFPGVIAQLTAIKAFGRINGSTGLIVSASDAFNATSAGGAGTYTITFANALANANYSVQVTIQQPTGAGNRRFVNVINTNNTSFQIITRDFTDSISSVSFLNFLVIGI